MGGKQAMKIFLIVLFLSTNCIKIALYYSDNVGKLPVRFTYSAGSSQTGYTPLNWIRKLMD